MHKPFVDFCVRHRIAITWALGISAAFVLLKLLAPNLLVGAGAVLAWVAAVIGGARLAGGGNRERERTPQEQRDAERDTEIVLDAFHENRNVAEIERRQAAAAGARAAQHGAVAEGVALQPAEMTVEERKIAIEKIKAALRRGASGLVVLALVFSAAVARADDSGVIRDGVSGWWMSDAEHAEYEQWAAELVQRRLQIADLNTQAAHLNRASYRERTANEICVSITRATQRKLEAEESRSAALAAWYRSPKFVAVTSVIAGLAAASAVAWAVR